MPICFNLYVCLNLKLVPKTSQVGPNSHFTYLKERVRCDLKRLKNRTQLMLFQLCPYPCEFSDYTIDVARSTEVHGTAGQFLLSMPDTVRVTEAFRSYGFVSFVGELGGWVGLFVGVSFVELNTLIASVVGRWQQ